MVASGAFGVITTHSMAISFPNYRRSEMSQIYFRHGDGRALHPNLQWDKIDIGDRNAILTDLHEHDHFDHLVSSPFGVLIFRIYNVITRDITYLGREFSDVGLHIKNGKKPLLKWLNDQGMKEYELRDSFKPIPGKAQYINEDVIPGLSAVVDLFTLLTAHSLPPEFTNLTVSGFCNLLNRAYTYLRIRCDIDLSSELAIGPSKDIGFRWNSLLPPDTLVFSKDLPFLSYYNVLEVLAYLHEYRFQKKNSAADVLNNWYKERVPEEYHVLLYLYLNVSPHISTSRSLLAMYLDSRIDITSGELNGKNTEHLIEDEWPFFFALHLKDAVAVYAKKLNTNIKGLESIKKRGKLFGEKSKWRDVQADHIGAMNFNSHALNLEGKFLTALERKLTCRVSEHNHNFLKLDVRDVLKTIRYRDEIQIQWHLDHSNPGTFLTSILETIFGALHPLMPTIAIAALYGRYVATPENLSEIVVKSINSQFEEILNASESPEIRNSIQEVMVGVESIAKQYLNVKTMEQSFRGVEIRWYVPISR